MAKILYFIILLLLMNKKIEAARILAVFPMPSISHQVVFRPLTQELAKRGHEVVVITPDPAFQEGATPANLTEIDIHDISYELWRKSFVSSSITKGNEGDWMIQLEHMLNIIGSIFEEQIKQEKVRNIIYDKTKKFDLLLIEDCILPALGLSYLHKVPVIQVSSLGAGVHSLHTVGAPIHALRLPLSIQQRIVGLSKWQKIKALYLFYRVQKILDKFETNSNRMMKNLFGPNVPDINELQNNVDMLFLNVHSIWEMNRPVPPNVIYMGGAHQKPQKELPQALKSYLDSSKNGVIYISFGTNVDPSLLPPERIQKIINVFAKLPYNILWKWNKDELPGRTENIKISKWLPQSDLLRHPNIKLFITQGGLQSTDEAITAGVPLIGMPMLGDQWFNCEQYELHKIGVRLDLETLTEEKLLSTINTVIGDESYRRNIKRLNAVMHDQPEGPLERAVWWTEYVLRNGGAKHLRTPTANITWWEYLELELVLYLLGGILSVILGLVLVVVHLYKYVTSRVTMKIKLKDY